MIEQMKSTSFKPTNDEAWREVAVKSLRGKPFSDLITQTNEKIDIQPLYTKEQIEQNSDLKTSIKRVRQANQTAKDSGDWTIAQQTYAKTGEEFLQLVKESLSRGNEAIVYIGTQPLTWEEKQLKALAELAQQYPIYAFDVKKEDSFLSLFDYISEENKKSVHGAVSGEQLDVLSGFENVRTICADVIKAHHDGADAVSELALVLAQAAEEALEFTDFSQLEERFFVRFAIDTHFFMEVAKIRAFRVLWQTLSKAYGHEESRSVPVFSENSLRTYSKLDPYVNLLRAGNEAFSAVIGGTDMLTVHPHNVLTGVTESSARYARNIQLVIKEETYVNKVIDVSGGSYYVETLTSELVEKAWLFFQEIESLGGYKKYVTSGQLEERLKQRYETRMKQVMHNETSLIGTNVYADLTTEPEEVKDGLEVEHRLAQPFEDLRDYFLNKQPKVVLLTFGELKDFKPRADFVGGFLATGGIKAEWSPAFSTVGEGVTWIKENDFDYGVICISAKETETVMGELVKQLPNDQWIDVAGRYDEAIEKNWLEAGLSGFIYQGQDRVAKLTAIKNKWEEVIGNEEA